MDTIILIAIIILVAALAVLKIVRDRKNGIKCTGCPHSGGCASAKKDNASCGCSNSE